MLAMVCLVVVTSSAALVPEGGARHRALDRLQQVFGLTTPEDTQHPEEAPQFMVELYNGIAGRDGVTRGHTPFDAKVVRSFIERDTSTPGYFFFNISGVPDSERVLEAQLRLFRMRYTPTSVLASSNYLMRVHQVLDQRRLDVPDVHRLLAVQYVNARTSGWQVFNVQQAVRSWISQASPNLGLLVSVTTLFGDAVNVRFARRGRHHNSHQPILVLFNGEQGRSRRSIPSPQVQARRNKREVTPSPSNASSECARRKLYVNFEQIGWSSWILSPRGYDAYYCRGHCDYPLGQSQRPSNHATVQSIVHELGLTEDVDKPCCVPTALLPTTLLYVDSNKNVVLKLYDEMVADSCGCQ